MGLHNKTGSYGNLTLSEGVRIVKYRGTGCITDRVKMQNTRRQVGACIIYDIDIYYRAPLRWDRRRPKYQGHIP